MKKLTVIAIVLGIILFLAWLDRNGGGSTGLDGDKIARLVYLLPLVALMGAGILAGRNNLSQSVRQLMIWVVIMLAIATASLFKDDLKRVGYRLLAGLVPGHAVEVTDIDGVPEVLLSRNIDGHYTANVTVNSQDISMLVDTGASSVVLSYEDAVTVGIIPENLAYSARVSTANGETVAAPIALTMVAIGPIRRENVGALVTRRGALDQSLLGMSFLTTLSSLHMQPDELRLRD